MKYMITSAEQVSNFLSALGLGLIIAVLYCVIEFIRKTISRKKSAIIIQDISFSLLCGLLLFVFMQIYTDGEVRLDLIISASIGFFVFYLSIGKRLNIALEKLSLKISTVLRFLFYPICFIMKKLSVIYIFVKNKIKVGFHKQRKPKEKIKKKLKKSKN